MGVSSSARGRAQHAEVAQDRAAAAAPVRLGESSLMTLAFVRIILGLLWFQQLSWKMPPTFGGLHGYVVREAQYTIVPGYSFILKNVFLTHFILLGSLVWSAELLVGTLLLLGLFTRVGALLSILLSLQLFVGLAYAPGEWYWTYGMIVLLGIAIAAVPAGRRLGLDRVILPRLQRAAASKRFARVALWFV